MSFNNLPIKQMEEQKRLGREYTLLELGKIKEDVWIPGNDSGEASKIIKIIADFETGKITGEEAIKKATDIKESKNLR